MTDIQIEKFDIILKKLTPEEIQFLRDILKQEKEESYEEGYQDRMELEGE